MRPEDIDEVLDLRASTRENALTVEDLQRGYGVTPNAIASAMRHDARGWVCKDDDRIVGFAMGNKATGEVTVVAVLPEHEGRGIGRRLLNSVCDWLFDEGHDEIWLLANPDPNVRASGFYKALGWVSSDVMKGGDIELKLSRSAYRRAGSRSPMPER